MNTFSINHSIEILERTPNVVESLLSGLSEDWIRSTDGEDGWSAFDIVGHYIHADNTNWMVRTNTFFEQNQPARFPSFTRDTMLEQNKLKSLDQLINEFKKVRAEKIQDLKNMNVSDSDLEREAIHPAFDLVKLKQLISTWVVHDLSHLAHIERALAKSYTQNVGPWKEYLTILKH